MSVKRYDISTFGGMCMESSLDGAYVHYEDYAALEQKLAESQREFRAADATIENMQMQVEKLAAENAGLNKFIKADCWVWDDKNEEYIDAVDCMPETPTTDAFLAEVRAQGVAMFSDWLIERIHGWQLEGVTPEDLLNFHQAVTYASGFAAQLRKECSHDTSQNSKPHA